VKAVQPSTLVTATYTVLGHLVNIITVLPVLGVHNTNHDIVEILANAQDMRKNGVQSVKPNILHAHKVIHAQTTVLKLVVLVVRSLRQANLSALMLIKSVLYVKLALIIAPVLALM
jgi:predicted ATPase